MKDQNILGPISYNHLYIKQRKQQILTFKWLKPEHTWHSILIIELNKLFYKLSIVN